MKITEFVKIHGVKGAIFDMDGTLTSSMSRWNEIYAILFDYLGLEFKEEFIMSVNHLSMKQIAAMLVNDFDLNDDCQKVYEYWLQSAVKYYENVFKIKPCMHNLLDDLKSMGIAACVATASDEHCAEAFIKSNKLYDYFGSVTSLNEVERPKSFPDIYLKAAQKLGLKPSECLVFEDALTAVKSAKSGGFFVCGVQDDCSSKDEEEIRAIADITFGFDGRV